MNYQDHSKKILIISFHFGPDTRVGGKRFSFLSRIFKEHYRELHILTLKEKFIPKKDNSLSGAGNIHRAGMYPSFPIEESNIFKKIFRRLWVDYLCFVDPFCGWIIPALFKGLKIIKERKINLIIATGPPFSSMVIGYLLSLVTNTKLILDYRDPWSNHNRKFNKFYGKVINRLFEIVSIRRASALVFCSRKMKNNFIDNLSKYAKINCHFIANGFQNTETIQPLSLGEDRKNIVYAGKLYGERRIKLIAKPLFQLIEDNIIPKNNFCFHVFGELYDEDRRIIKEYGLQEIIKERARVPHKQLIKYLKSADILLLPSGSDVSYAIPFKFYDYLSVKRPILAIAPENSAVAEMINQIDCGRLALINSEKSIQYNLHKMFSEEKKYTFSGAEDYTWENIGSKYMGVINKVYR